MQRFIFPSPQSEHPQSEAWVMRHVGWREQGEERRGERKQAGRRDKAIALHCQSGEAINNCVTIKRERGRE